MAVTVNSVAFSQVHSDTSRAVSRAHLGPSNGSLGLAWSRGRSISRSNGQLVALQLEKSHLVVPGQKLIPGYIDLGRELVVLDCEWAAVNHQRLEETCRLCIVCRRLAICRRDDDGTTDTCRLVTAR